jgi:hypothetical protein
MSIAVYALVACAILASCAPGGSARRESPDLSIEPEVWEFGTIERGQVVYKGLKVTNRGPDTLGIKVYSTCDCLSVLNQTETVLPGETAIIDVTYMGDEIKDTVTKTLFVDAGDPEKQRLSLRVTGTVIPGKAPHLVILPDPLPLDASSGDRQELELQVTNRGEEVLEIKDVSCFGCLNQWNNMELFQGEEMTLGIRTIPGWTGGRWVEIRSNDPVQPLKKIAILEVD